MEHSVINLLLNSSGKEVFCNIFAKKYLKKLKNKYIHVEKYMVVASLETDFLW